MGKLKCAQYWPDHDKPPIMFGNICVSVVEHQQKPSFEFRKLSVECEVSRSNCHSGVTIFNCTHFNNFLLTIRERPGL